jgi:glycosyltransferase involved in cell wall biosynthesis
MSRDEERRRILFVSSSLAGGGAERFVSTVLSCLDRERFRPSLCLFRRDVVYPLAEDVPVSVVEKTRPWQLPFAVLGLARLIDRQRPDAIFSAFASPSFVTGNALRLARHRPAWIARVSSDPDHTEPGPLRPWMRTLYGRADLVVANARALCARFDAVYGGSGARWLPNATDFDSLEALARNPAPATASGRRRIVSLGRLERVKRFDLLLEAAARLQPETDLELVICGEGAERPALERQARELGLADRLQLPGFLSNPFPWLAASDLFVLTSDAEGLPNALLEAQGLGLAAVATDCDHGPREIVDDRETGRLVPTGDAAALADAIGQLLADDALRREMGERARTRIRARYAAEPVTRALEDLLLEVTPR